MSTIKAITYNIDGLPEVLDLNDLPWLLKPVAWIFKLFKGTTLVTVNDNKGGKERTAEISQRLHDSDFDIICVQEDFNNHTELTSCLQEYQQGTFMGAIDLSRIFSMVRWLPIPRYKSDGLCFFSKHLIVEEWIVPWKHSYGYFSHANDKLMMKGFRRYVINKDGVYIDVYVVHMDADFYDPVTCPDVSGDIKARKKQTEQLHQFIANHPTTNPIIIIGDTNCLDPLGWKEVVASNHRDVDRVFYINHPEATYKIKPAECQYCTDYTGLSDHLPLEVTFSIIKNK